MSFASGDEDGAGVGVSVGFLAGGLVLIAVQRSPEHAGALLA